MKPIIRIEGLGKRYRIGARAPYTTLRESLVSSWTGALQHLRLIGKNGAAGAANGDDNHIWALRDVSLDVMPGEVLGVIGRNGAGKSTLLKILSRITEPTTGRVDLYGRVGSLLEVGTGFHPELTGRENIYLSAAIMGMRRAEIERKFDEIVAFADVEKFLDTPVKHYSSGMYVRLAFAVAAHLEPEILLVDEVLAVGDAEFQKKCLGKLNNAASAGRTVIFVSHNMAAVQKLCHKAILLNQGKTKETGDSNTVVASYLGSGAYTALAWERSEIADSPCYFAKIWLGDELSVHPGYVTTTGCCVVNLDFVVTSRIRGLQVSIGLLDGSDEQIFGTSPQDAGLAPPDAEGKYHARVVLPADLLLPRPYAIRAVLWHPFLGRFDKVDALRFTPEETTSLANLTGIARPGLLAVRCEWSIAPLRDTHPSN